MQSRSCSREAPLVIIKRDNHPVSLLRSNDCKCFHSDQLNEYEMCYYDEDECDDFREQLNK